MKTFKSLSDFKRNLKVGDKLHGIRHISSGPIFQDTDLGTREVCTRDSKSFALATLTTTGDLMPSWLPFPPSSLVEFKGDIIEIYVRDERGWKGGVWGESNPEFAALPKLKFYTFKIVEK